MERKVLTSKEAIKLLPDSPIVVLLSKAATKRISFTKESVEYLLNNYHSELSGGTAEKLGFGMVIHMNEIMFIQTKPFNG